MHPQVIKDPQFHSHLDLSFTKMAPSRTQKSEPLKKQNKRLGTKNAKTKTIREKYSRKTERFETKRITTKNAKSKTIAKDSGRTRRFEKSRPLLLQEPKSNKANQRSKKKSVKQDFCIPKAPINR